MTKRKPLQPPASFDVTRREAALIRRIVDRMLRSHPTGIDRLALTMDITACHANGNPLRLAALSRAAEEDFVHDVYGIMQHIDRHSGMLASQFLPRYSVRVVRRG